MMELLLALVVACIAATTADAVNPFGSEVPKVDNYLPVRNPVFLRVFARDIKLLLLAPEPPMTPPTFPSPFPPRDRSFPPPFFSSDSPRSPCFSPTARLALPRASTTTW